MSHLVAGILAERALARQLRGRGYEVTRSAASKGRYDLIASNRREIVYCSVKRSRAWTPSHERRALAALRAANVPRASVVKRQLWVWRPRRGWAMIPVA